MIIEEIPMDVKVANIRAINKELVSLIEELEIAEYDLNYSKSGIREGSPARIKSLQIKIINVFEKDIG